MLKLALLTIGIVFIAIILLCVKLIFVRNGKFSSMHIGDSKEMKRRGIHCVQSMDAMARKENPYKVKEHSR
jgi:hypothetical protein